jgi:hypothetical protein
LLFCAVTIEELGQGQTGLKLYRVTRHDLLSSIHSIGYHFTGTAEVWLRLMRNQVTSWPSETMPRGATCGQSARVALWRLGRTTGPSTTRQGR